VTDHPLYNDHVFLSRVNFLLRLLDISLQNFSEDFSEEILKNHIVPLGFVFIEHPNKEVNSRAHSVFQGIFAQIQVWNIASEIVPYYLKRSLHNYPKLTDISSLASSMTTLITSISSNSPLINFVLKSIFDVILERNFTFSESEFISLSDTKSPTSNLVQKSSTPNSEESKKLSENTSQQMETPLNKEIPNNKTIVQKEKRRAPYLTILFLEMINYVPRQQLKFQLQLISDLVKKSAKNVQIMLCHLLFEIISKNFDYTRKEICIKWYLELCSNLRIPKL